MKYTRIQLGLLALSSLAGGSALASPSECSSAYSTLESYVSSPSYYNQILSDELDYAAECFPGESPVTSQRISATMFAQSSAISSALGNRFLASGPQKQAFDTHGMLGMAAGGAGPQWNLWANASFNSADYRANTSSAAVPAGVHRSSMDIDNYVVGADMSISPSLVAGVSLGIDRSDGKIGAIKEDASGDGYTVAPYIGWQLSNNLVLDASLGFGEADSKVSVSKSDQDRFFYSANLSYVDWRGAWQLSGKASYLYGSEDSSNLKVNGVKLPSTGDKAHTSQAKVGAEAAYWLAEGVMPYVGIVYAYDLSRSAGPLPWDESAFVYSAGVNFISLKNKMTGGIAYVAEDSRSNTNNDSVVLNISVRF